jgi:hypothetical protein
MLRLLVVDDMELDCLIFLEFLVLK